MLIYLILISTLYRIINGELSAEEVQYLNELTLDKLLKLKNSLKEFANEYENITSTSPSVIEKFGAQAMAVKAPPIKRTDYEDSLFKKNGYGKISNIFTISVTTLAFLAFGGYLLCLIVQAVKSKQNTVVTTPTPTFFVNAGIKRPHPTFSTYGHRKRERRGVNDLNIPPDELYAVLIQFCEGYAKWSKKHDT